jgi:HlyD family secretion protein
MSDRSAQLHSLSIDREDTPSRSGLGFGAVLVIALIAAGLGAGGAWYLTQGSPPAPVETQTASTPAPTRDNPPAETTTAPAAPPAPRASGLVASGYVVARRQATVSAEITGRIREVYVEEGTRVDEGDILARLDDDRARIQLDLLRAQLSASGSRINALQAQLGEARRVLVRASELESRAIGSEANVTAAQAQVDSLVAQLSAARSDATASRAMVRSQEDLVERHVVRAPFAGVVIAKNAQVGEILSPSSAGGGFTRTGVATLVDMQSLELEVDVNEGQIGRIEAGQRAEARLDAYPDWRIPAHVEAIIPTADRSRATIQVRVAFDERDGRILPDMAARVTFVE